MYTPEQSLPKGNHELAVKQRSWSPHLGGKPLASNLTWQKGSTPSNESYELSSPRGRIHPRQSLTKNLNANLEEAKKARARMDDIQSRQSYVGFLPDELMSAMPAEAADFFRKGGEELDLSTYWHGVKSQTVSYHRFKETDEWKTENGKVDFAIESSTMCFLWSVRGDKTLILSGRCERIYKDKGGNEGH
jgi:hypothetical protein